MGNPWRFYVPCSRGKTNGAEAAASAPGHGTRAPVRLHAAGAASLLIYTGYCATAVSATGPPIMLPSRSTERNTKTDTSVPDSTGASYVTVTA